MKKIFMGKLVAGWAIASCAKIGRVIPVIGRVIAVDDSGLAVKLCSYCYKGGTSFHAPIGTGIGFFPFESGIAEVTDDWMKTHDIEEIKE